MDTAGLAGRGRLSFLLRCRVDTRGVSAVLDAFNIKPSYVGAGGRVLGDIPAPFVGPAYRIIYARTFSNGLNVTMVISGREIIRPSARL